MDAEFERRYELIEQRAAAAEERWKRRMDADEAKWMARMAAAEVRMDKHDKRMHELDQQARERAIRADARSDRFDIKLEATRKLVEGGMKFVMKNTAEIKAINKRIDDYIRGLGNGGGSNGRGHRGKPS